MAITWKSATILTELASALLIAQVTLTADVENHDSLMSHLDDAFHRRKIICWDFYHHSPSSTESSGSARMLVELPGKQCEPHHDVSDDEQKKGVLKAARINFVIDFYQLEHAPNCDCCCRQHQDTVYLGKTAGST